MFIKAILLVLGDPTAKNKLLF